MSECLTPPKAQKTRRPTEICTHCYMSAEGTVELNGKTVRLKQETKYPYEGSVSINIGTEGNYTIALRIPGWAGQAAILVNGEKAKYEVITGYAYIARNWKAGDTLTLELSMQVRVVEANPRVLDVSGRAAITRGPLVYCAEGLDNADRPMRDIRISRENSFLENIEQIEGAAMPVLRTKGYIRKAIDELYTDIPIEEEEIELKLIPYFAWTNRGITEMTTWFLLK